MVTDHQTAQEDSSGVLVPDVREKLRRSGYTLTSQRRAVLEALSRAKGHPSAEDVYLIVKRENPRVALGTVYQALSVLEEVGIIGSKHWAESPTRYDLNVEPHLDIRCISCGEVSEVPGSHSAAWKSASATILLTGSPARRWSSRACALPASTASQQGLYPEPAKSYPFDQRGVAGNTGEAIMSEDPRDKAAALAEGMEAAGALIENLEQEVADLRSDLDQAAVALKAAQEEVSSRAGALEEKERARVEAESEVEDLRAEISALKQQHSDEQLLISNEHINELAEVRRRLEEQRQTDVDAASSGSRLDTIKEEFRREREALEARYREEIGALKTPPSIGRSS